MNTNDRSIAAAICGRPVENLRLLDLRRGILPKTDRELAIVDRYEKVYEDALNRTKDEYKKKIERQRGELAHLHKTNKDQWKKLKEQSRQLASYSSELKVLRLEVEGLQAERDRAIEERDRITRLWDRKSGMI